MPLAAALHQVPHLFQAVPYIPGFTLKKNKKLNPSAPDCTRTEECVLKRCLHSWLPATVKPCTLLRPPRVPSETTRRGAGLEGRQPGSAAVGKALTRSPSEGRTATRSGGAVALARLRTWGLCGNAGGCCLPSAPAPPLAPNKLVAQPLISGMKFPADAAGAASGRAPAYPGPAALPFVPSWLSVPVALPEPRCVW